MAASSRPHQKANPRQSRNRPDRPAGVDANPTTFLALNVVPVPDIDVDAAEAFMLGVAKGELTEVAQIEAGLLTLYSR